MAIAFSSDTGAFEIGSYRGAPILLSPFFFLVAAVLAFPFWRMVSLAGIVLALVFIAVVFGSILLHELAHARIARRYGVAARRIDINASGGLVRFSSHPRTMLQDVAITLAGPLANLGIGLVALGLAALLPPPPPPDAMMLGHSFLPDPDRIFGFAGQAVRATAYLNLALCVVNLLPGVPLDGGKLLYLLVERRWNSRIALLTVSSCGLVLASLMTLVAIVGLMMGIGIWSPPDFDINKHAFDAARQGRGGWDAYAFPWG
jgi:stage IV sporulation protein FB